MSEVENTKVDTKIKESSVIKGSTLKTTGSVKDQKFSGGEDSKIPRSPSQGEKGDLKLKNKMPTQITGSDSEPVGKELISSGGGLLSISNAEQEANNKPRTSSEDTNGQPPSRLAVTPNSGAVATNPLAEDSASKKEGFWEINGQSMSNDNTGSLKRLNQNRRSLSMETKYENDKAELAAKVTMSPRYQLFLANENQDRLTDTAHTRIQNEQYGLKHTAKSTDPALSEGSTVTRTTDSGLDSTVGSEPGHEISPNLGPSTNPNKTDRGEATEFVGGNYSEALSIKIPGNETPPRAFNSPYRSPSAEYDRIFRMSDFKECLSPTPSEVSLNSMSSYSQWSGVTLPQTSFPQGRFAIYESWGRLKGMLPALPNLRPGIHHKRDYIQELIRLLDVSEKRNAFLEAESLEMSRERGRIRYEMRGLLVNNEDLIRNMAVMQNELKKLKDRVLELERENFTLNESITQLERELSNAKEVLGEANDQEYAFTYLQQSLHQKLLEAQEALDNQSKRCDAMAEKLWLAERNQDQLETEKQNLDTKIVSLSSTVLRLETELGEALKVSAEAAAGITLHQQYKEKTQNSIEELEERLKEKCQELEEAQCNRTRQLEELSLKQLDKDRQLEEEIQLRERLQLLSKQAERSIEDLQMELQTTTQAKEELSKQLKQAQETIIDLESDLEEMNDTEHRWAGKHKRTMEQNEQLQIKLLHERDLREQLECDKQMLERQNKDLELELRDLRSSQTHEDILSKTEIKAKEMESSLRAEERNKATLMGIIQKMERKNKDLSEQMDEERRQLEEEKDQLGQRMKSLKRQLGQAEEEMERREAQNRHIQREMAELKESNSLLQKQLSDLQIQLKQKESFMMKKSRDILNMRIDLDSEEEEEAVSDILKQ
ncbi:cingulin-like [Acipenser ruthenus]|uniref:cingulin-like n=1 Tax=Acipenser ruthenus TaxID=7906 RepID=UPI0027407522|nr:cingulin-like [Acipenser ruthenus]XP_058880412.1 cingulin-like [Acipenser ruthenus]XP_058880415.1 cingulin-like [Acipenser ruthenus]XP_058880420.1 cingulin-like [Acipenser ruthenus]XP_058880423.1 cingulin-like [Acipenser ruthenus]